METTDAAFAFQPPQAAWPRMNALAHEPPADGDARQRRPRHPECVMYTDEQLVMTSGAKLPATFSLLADLLAAPHSAARQPLVRGMLHAVGFEWLAYGTMRVHGRGWRPTSFLTTYAHPEWADAYFLEGWHDIDSRLHAAPPSGLPIAWDLQDLRSLPLPASRATAHRHFTQALERSGQRSGVLLSVPSASERGERTFVGLTSAAPTRAWIDDNVMRQAIMLALCLHDFLSQRTQLNTDVPPHP